MHYFIMQNPFSFFPHLSHSLAYFSIIISHCAGASFVLQLHLYFFVVVFLLLLSFFPLSSLSGCLLLLLELYPRHDRMDVET